MDLNADRCILKNKQNAATDQSLFLKNILQKHNIQGRIYPTLAGSYFSEKLSN